MKTKRHRKRRTIVVALLVTLLILGMYSTLNYFYFEKELVLDQNNSYWTSVVDTSTHQTITTNAAVDIAIIGGGYTGLSAAWHLAQKNPDKKIILLEAKTLGNGASGRHGGMLLPMLLPPGESSDYSLEELKVIYDRSAANIRKIREIEQISGVPCDLETNGIVYAIFQKDGATAAREYVRQCQATGFPISYLDKEQVAAKLGTSRYEAGIYIPDGGSVHAMKLVLALKSLAEKAGVTIYEYSAVTHIEEGKTLKLTIGSNQAEVVAQHVVLATNAFTSKLGYFKGQVMPLHIITASTPPLTPKQLEGIGWTSRLPFADSRIELFHLVLTPDNRIIIGGGYSNYFYNNDLNFKDNKEEIAKVAMEELVKMFPSLEGIKFEYAWNGIIGVTMGMAEIYGVTGKHNNIYYALGYNGHGVNASIMYGGILAELYSGERSEYTTINKGTSLMLPPEPFRYIGVRSFLKYGRWSDTKK